MYLSKLILNLKSQLVQKELKDCYLMHQRILTGFSEKHVSSDIDFFDSVKDIKDGWSSRPKNTRSFNEVLYRIERNGMILVQSKIMPKWDTLPENYLLKDKYDGFQVNDLSNLLHVLKDGTSAYFRLKAHPTFKIKVKNGQKHWRKSLYKPEEVEAWIYSKAKSFEFKINNVDAMHQVNVKGKKSENRLDFISFLFEGNLTIKNLDRFKVGLQEGIGRGKSFGFGLLSIAPAN